MVYNSPQHQYTFELMPTELSAEPIQMNNYMLTFSKIAGSKSETQLPEWFTYLSLPWEI